MRYAVADEVAPRGMQMTIDIRRALNGDRHSENVSPRIGAMKELNTTG